MNSTPQTRTTLVTGASSGIGREIARVAAQNGDRLVLVARRRERLEQLAAELQDEWGTTSTVLPLDLTADGAAATMREATDSRGLSIDILVNNAGLGQHGAFVGQELSELDAMMQLNMRALTLATREFLPGMVERGWGRVLNVASTSAFQPGPGMAVYHATKAYVLSLGEALDHELGGTGVSVTTLCPRMTESEFFETAGVARTKALQRILADPHEVALAGYRGALKGRRVVVPGASNKVLAYGSSALPRRLVTSITARVIDQGR
jgi:uncharacterized protein